MNDMFSFVWKENGVVSGLRAHKEYSTEKVDTTKDWLETRPWCTTLTVSGVSAVLLYLLDYPYFVLAAVCLGAYLITSLRWIRSYDSWTIMFQSTFFLLGMLGMALVLYAASIHPARTMSEFTGREIITMCGASFASVVIFLISFIESKAGTWLHARIPIVVMVGSGVQLGLEWMWLGLLFPAVVLISVRLARYVVFLFRFFIGNHVLNFIRKDQH